MEVNVLHNVKIGLLPRGGLQICLSRKIYLRPESVGSPNRTNLWLFVGSLNTILDNARTYFPGFYSIG
jgi:hypothetical protein